MIDYEFTIRRLEKELIHYREMQEIQRSHIDAHDRSIEALHAIADRTERNLDKLAGDLQKLADDLDKQSTNIDKLTANMNALVDALLREHPNGRG